MRSAAFDDWVNRARSADLQETAERLGATLKRAGHERIGPCPACGGTDRFSINPRKGVFNCRGARGGDVIAMVEHVEGVAFLQAVQWINGEPPPDGRQDSPEDRQRARRRREELERKRQQRELQQSRREESVRDVARRIWRAAVPVEGTPAETYLKSRIKKFSGPTGPLRYVPDLPYPDDKNTHPAIVAAVAGPDHRFMGIWRIYITPTGEKADVPNAKLGLGPCTGGAVWIGDPGDKTAHVTEGVETGFGVLQILGGRAKVAATLSTSGMVNFEPEPGTELIRIWPDGDRDRIKRVKGKTGAVTEHHLESPGLRAAKELDQKLQERGWRSVVQDTPQIGSDYLDVWNATHEWRDGYR